MAEGIGIFEEFAHEPGLARGSHRMAIYDGKTGKKIYDDGRLDGRACAVGKKAIYNPNTGRFVTVPAAKCNF